MARLLALMALAIALLRGALPAGAAAPCQFVLGFKQLYDLVPQTVGGCVDNQAFAADGDAQQHTTGGLLVWRKVDNWTAFTNGYWTWVQGPYGLQKRLNTQRFSWEANPGSLPQAGPVTNATLSVTAAVQQPMPVAPPAITPLPGVAGSEVDWQALQTTFHADVETGYTTPAFPAFVQGGFRTLDAQAAPPGMLFAVLLVTITNSGSVPDLPFVPLGLQDSQGHLYTQSSASATQASAYYFQSQASVGRLAPGQSAPLVVQIDVPTTAKDLTVVSTWTAPTIPQIKPVPLPSGEPGVPLTPRDFIQQQKP